MAAEAGKDANVRLLVCVAVLGRIYHCSDYIHGASLQAGFNSHMSPDGREYVLFDAAQVLPVLLLHLQPTYGGQAKPATLAAAPLHEETRRAPKDNAAFYLGEGRQVLAMASIDEDDDTGLAGEDAEIQVSRYKEDWS